MHTSTITPTTKNTYINSDVSIVNTVYETRNHDLFSKILGNREISQANVNRLKRSFEEKQLQVPLIVNELYQVIDGQHRLEVCRELKLPTTFIVVDGYTLEDVQRVNSISRQWNIDDCVDSYCNLGNENYIKYRDFKNKYNFGHCETRYLLGDYDNNSKISERFRSGKLIVGDVLAGSRKAEMIYKVKPYYNGFKRRNFVLAMIRLFKCPNYNHRTFIHKLSLQSMAMQDQARTDQYIQNIEMIYNYRNRNRVRFF